MVFMLADVRDKLVKSVDISMDINQISDEVINSLDRFTVNDSGKLLKFCIYDPADQLRINLFSRNKQVQLTDEFIRYLQSNPVFEFRLA